MALEAKFFLPRADADFATILPALFFTRDALVKPPVVFSLPPLKTTSRARLPVATLLVTLAFITLSFIAGFIASFMASFMAGFIAGFVAGFMAAGVLTIAVVDGKLLKKYPH